MMENAKRYRLIPGEAIWIVNTRDNRFNPVFVLRGHDGKYARQLLANLNRIRENGEEVVAFESRELAGTSRR
jgi:hypothetical protein